MNSRSIGERIKRIAIGCRDLAQRPAVRKWGRRCAVGSAVLLFLFSVACYAGMYVRRSNGGLSFSNQLRIPEQLTGEQSDGRRRYELAVATGTSQFLPGQSTETAGVNGSYLGPTLRMRRGDQVDLVVANHLSEETTMHWHGMHVPAQMDGTPHQIIEPGETWTASYEVDQQAATMWYHPHPHGNTGRQAYQGIAGLLIIDDDNSESLDLPNTYGVDDIPLVIQDKLLDDRGQLQFRINQGALYGDQILVNGTWNPSLSIESGLIRFRLLNASNARIFYLGFEDDREFQLIATDGGFLESPFATRRIVLSPGERAEILVDFSDGNEALLKSFPEAGFLMSAESFFAGIGTSHFDLLKIRPTGSSSTSRSIPSRLNTIKRISEDEADVVRPMLLGGFGGGGGPQNQRGGGPQNDRGGGPQNRRGGGGRNGFAPPINGKWMDMHRVDEVVRLGDTEIWELTNRTGQPHPFHVHLVQFQVLDRNGSPPSAPESGWKDTVLVHPGDRVRIIMRFTRYSDPQTPYMYHCHIMEHEDRGMMGQFLVVEQPDQLAAIQDKTSVVVFIAGFACQHCFEQVMLFDQKLAEAGVNLLIVTPDGGPHQQVEETIRGTIVSDPEKRWAGWLGLLHDGPAHGTYLLDRDGQIIWRDDSDEPYMDVETILEQASLE